MKQLNHLIIVSLVTFVSASNNANLFASPEELTVLVGGNCTFHLRTRNIHNATINISVNHKELLVVVPTHLNVSGNTTVLIIVEGLNAGHAVVSADLSFPNISTVIQVTIEHSIAVYHVSAVVGWIYFVAWSISFYPQIIENWRRKSVVGLNFDFLALNLVGFVLYSLFNCGLYWIPKIEEQYFERFPQGHNPVQINDIVFSLHAVFATLLTITQCFFYERANQALSLVAKIILGIFLAFLEISYFLAGIDVIFWLDFLNYCSYVKLAITLIKYLPQAYMNYRRQSTVGWSIGNILLDFTGGTLSMLQMILNAYNYNDWASIFGDPTKFGLGLFSVVFDVFFMVQHYILYRHSSHHEVDGCSSPSTITTAASTTALPSTTALNSSSDSSSEDLRDSDLEK